MNREEKTEQIYIKALKIFGKYGYKKTTLDDIAKELGMTKGNLYLYVKDKRDLYDKTVAFGLKRWQTRVVSSIQGMDDVVEQFYTISGKSLQYLSEDEDMCAILMNDPATFPLYPEEDRFYAINLESMNVVKDILRKGIAEKKFREVDVDYVTQFIYSVYIMFILKLYVKEEGKSVEKMFASALDLALNGLIQK